MRKEWSLQQMVLGKPCIHMQKNGIGPLFYPIQKINSKWIRDLNVKSETAKFLEQKENLHDIGLGNGVFYVHTLFV